MKKKATSLKELQPYMLESKAASSSPTTDTRRNVAGSIERTDKYINIENGLVPFRNSSTIYGPSTNMLDVRDAVILCQKAYYNFAVFRNIIDLMTEFSVSPIYYRGGSKQNRDFFQALFNKINLWDFMDKFFREYYRSGNIFVYRFDADIKPDDIKKITQVFAASKRQTDNPDWPYYGDKVTPTKGDGDFYYSSKEDRLAPPFPDPGHPDFISIEKMRVPARYIILNPADIQMMSTLNFAFGLYFKILTDSEVARLRHPKVPEDMAVYENLPPQAKQQVKAGARIIAVPLDQDKVSMIFYKKQDYEPFAVPMGYPVLEDINFKAEMRKIDMAVARTMQQMVLLVTCGAKPDEGGINQKNLDALRQLFKNESVGRTLIADYTTDVKFVVPTVADLLDPQKYEVVNADINMGLHNVFAGDEKFANQQQKVQLFVARLEQGRQAFLNNFLIPEIKRISKALGFKNFPTPYFEDIKLKDSTNIDRLYTRLMELGLLTPEQGFKALETGTLPDPAVMNDAQKEYKDDRDKGLYTPLIGGAKQQGDAGRPNATPSPQTTKSVGPIGTSSAAVATAKESPKFSVTKVKENMILAQEVEKTITDIVKEKGKIKRMTKAQKEAVAALVSDIIANEEPEEWIDKAKEYADNPPAQDRNPKRVGEMMAIADKHQIDFYVAGLLLASKVNE